VQQSLKRKSDKAGNEHNRHDMPLPFDHASERDGVNGAGEPIENMRLGKEDMDAEPDGEVEHHAYHGSGHGRQRRIEKPHAAQLLDLWRACLGFLKTGILLPGG
jgi:hypothetical protein